MWDETSKIETNKNISHSYEERQINNDTSQKMEDKTIHNKANQMTFLAVQI